MIIIWILFNCCCGASILIHQRLLHQVMRSPMSFFDTNPTGRIINRFSADIDTIDNSIPFNLIGFMWCTSELLGIVMYELHV